MVSASRIDLSGKRRELLASLLRAEGVRRAPAPTIPRRPDPGAPVPLSFPQRRLWFLEQLAPGNPAYTIPTAVRVRGELDTDAFSRACAAVVRRHESLRTVFVDVDGEPWQRVRVDLPVDPLLVDLRRKPDAAGQVRQRAEALFARPFDLSTGPLLRIELLRLAADETVVLLAMHHLVSDLWSMGVLLREIVAGYGQAAFGVPAALPDLPVQYPDLALWQQDSAAQQSWRADLDYWADRLTGAPAELDLPATRPRPARPSHRGTFAPVRLAPDAVARLRRLARTEGTTPFVLLLAAFKTLLFRLSGQPDVVVGTPVANRSRPEFEPLIGFLVNTVVLRSDLSGDQTFRQLVARVEQTRRSALEHQDLPFERLVEELRPDRSPGTTPLFQVSFLYQNIPLPTGDIGPIRVEPVPVDPGTVKYDLQLQLVETDGAIEGRLEGSLDLFAPATVRHLAGYLGRLLDGALTDPDRTLLRLPLLADGELAHHVNTFNEPYPLLVAEGHRAWPHG